MRFPPHGREQDNSLRFIHHNHHDRTRGNHRHHTLPHHRHNSHRFPQASLSSVQNESALSLQQQGVLGAHPSRSVHLYQNRSIRISFDPRQGEFLVQDSQSQGHGQSFQYQENYYGQNGSHFYQNSQDRPNLLQINSQHRSNLQQNSSQHRAHLQQNSSQHRAHLQQNSSQHRAHLQQNSSQHRAHLQQNSSQHRAHLQQNSEQNPTPLDLRSITAPPSAQHQPVCDIEQVKMISLPFYQVEDTPLQVMIKTYAPHWMSYHRFVLEKSLLNQLKCQGTSSPYEIHVRLCLYDKEKEQKDYFPSDLMVKVNGQACLLPGWNTIPKGPAGPITITRLCAYENNPNMIQVRTREHVVVHVLVIKRLNHQHLMMKLLAKSPIPPATTTAKIKEKLQQDGNASGDITMTSIQFSLTCPISKVRMKHPCRASTCQHLQCFDAGYYLKMNEMKPKWICPWCSEVIEYKNLEIDLHFQNILENNTSSDKILLQEDGSCKPFQANDMDESILTLDDTLDQSVADGRDPHCADDTEDPNPAGAAGGDGGGPRKKSSNGNKKQNTTIDLLSDDDSDSDHKLNSPVGKSKNCASHKGNKTPTSSEVVTLSDDETGFTPASKTPVPRRLTRSTTHRLKEGATRTPKPHKQKQKKSKLRKLFRSESPISISTPVSRSSSFGNVMDDFIPL